MQKRSVWMIVLDIAAGLAVAGAASMVFLYAPMEATMGNVQRVFYFHVANAWLGMLAFTLAMVAGIIYLVKKQPVWDIVGMASVEIGMVFMFAAIVSGSIWARPIWNTWWTWDPRLTTTTIMELVFAAYLLLRQGIEEPERRARFGAVYAIVGFLSVPLTFFSIRIFRTIHPVVVGANEAGAMGAFDMTPKMGLTFAVSLIAYTILFAALIWHRIRLGQRMAQVEEQKMRLAQ